MIEYGHMLCRICNGVLTPTDAEDEGPRAVAQFLIVDGQLEVIQDQPHSKECNWFTICLPCIRKIKQLRFSELGDKMIVAETLEEYERRDAEIQQEEQHRDMLDEMEGA